MSEQSVSEIEIRLRATADSAAVDKMGASVKNTAAQARTAGAYFDGLSYTTRKVAQAADEASDSVTRMGLSKKEANKAAKILSHEAGGLGRILKFAFQPQILLIAAVGFAIGKVTDYVAKMKEKFLQAAAAVNDMNDSRVKAMGDAAREASEDINKFNIELQQSAINENKDKEAAEARIAIYNAEQDAIIAVIEAREKSIQSQISELETSNQITKSQAEAAKKESEARVQSAKDSGDHNKEQKKIVEMEAELAAAQKRRAEGESDVVRNARKTTAAEVYQQKKLQLEADAAEKKFVDPKNETKQKIDQVRADLDEAKKNHYELKNLPASDPRRRAKYYGLALSQAGQAVENKSAELKGLEAQRDADAVSIENQKNKAQAAKEELERRAALIKQQEEQAKKDEKTVAEMPDKIKHAKELESVKTKGRKDASNAAEGVTPRSVLDDTRRREIADTASETPANQFGIEAQRARVAAENVIARMRGRLGDPKKNETELLDLLAKMMGLLEDVQGDKVSKDSLRPLIKRIQDLESRQGKSRQP